MKNGTSNISDTQETLLSIEDIYTQKAISLCSREGDDILISQIIKELKAKIYMLAVSPLTDEEKDDNLLDMLDFIDQDLLSHAKLVNVLNKFIRAEFKFVSETLKKKGSKSKNTKREILETLEINDNSQVEEAKKQIENYSKIIEKEQKRISDAEKIIQDAENMITRGDNTTISISHEMIHDEELEIEEAKKIIDEANRRIDEATVIIDKESLKQSLTEKYTDKITSLYDSKNDKQLAINSINFIVNRIKTIVENKNVNLKRKKDLIFKQAGLLEDHFLNNNKEAMDLLKEFAVLKCKEEIGKLEQSAYSISIEDTRFAPPIKVSEQLRITHRKYGNKAKCTKFIIEVYNVIPFLLKAVSENEDPIIFKTEYILPILDKLEIPERFHKDFMKIVDMYRIEEKTQLFKLARNDVYRKSQLMQANLHLEGALLECNNNQNLIKECQDFVNHIQVNMFTNLAKDRQLEKAEAAIALEEKEGTVDNVSYIVQRLHRRRLGKPSNNPYKETITSAIKDRKSLKRGLTPMSLKKERITETKNPYLEKLVEKIEDFNITSERVKNRLMLYVECYFNHIKTMVIMDELASQKIFREIKIKNRG